MLSTIRNYVFVPSGETIRAGEVTVATAVVGALYRQDLTQLGNWKLWAVAGAVAGIEALVGFAKGKLPSTP